MPHFMQNGKQQTHVDWDLVIIGAGVSSLVFNFTYLNHYFLNKKSAPRVLQICADDFYPAGSHVPIVLMSLSGIAAGVSPLGDQLVESFAKASEFIHKFSPPGFLPLEHQDLADKKLVKHWESFLSRHKRHPQLVESDEKNFSSSLEVYTGPAYLVESQKFLTWLKDEILKMQGNFLSAVVCSIQSDEKGTFVQTRSGEKIYGKKFLFCPGAWARENPPIFGQFKLIQQYLEKSHVVSGAQWSCPVDSWGDKSLAYTLARANLIYHAQTQMVTIGSASISPLTFAPPIEELRKQYELYSSILKNKKLPEFKRGNIFCGARLKGSGRRPFWGEIGTMTKGKIFAILGLYKSGFAYSFLASEKMVSLINEEIK